MHRHTFLASTLATLATAPRAASAATPSPEAALAALERAHGGRLGVVILDTGSGRTITHRANERFAMCSTFKLLAVGAVLRQADRGNEHLDRGIAYLASDLLPYAPATRKRMGSRGVATMSIGELCKAAIELSDNTAANLLLHTLAGPAGVTRFARAIGDPVTRLDRNEPTLNTAIPGDPRDTTTPLAIAHDLQRLLLGNVLSAPAKVHLKTWLLGCRTGLDALRAGFPAMWPAGDKTGSGANATSNDVAIAYPPNRAPLIITAYYTGSKADENTRAATLAAIGKIAAAL